jgi:hypothetical protein
MEEKTAFGALKISVGAARTWGGVPQSGRKRSPLAVCAPRSSVRAVLARGVTIDVCLLSRRGSKRTIGGAAAQAPTTFFQCGGSTATSAGFIATAGLNAKFTVYDPSATAIAEWKGEFAHIETAPFPIYGLASAVYNIAAVVSVFKVMMSSGNIASGTIKV